MKFGTHMQLSMYFPEVNLKIDFAAMVTCHLPSNYENWSIFAFYRKEMVFILPNSPKMDNKLNFVHKISLATMATFSC